MASVADTGKGDTRRDADHESFLSHKRMRWLWIALFLSIASAIGYALIDVEPRPNGGTWYGYLLGTIGALLIVWLSLLGIRKRAMTEGKWSLKAWTSAHVYLGLALIVIATLHTGFQIGWNVHTLAYVLMMLVILSGIYGITVYAKLPQSLSDNRKNMTRGEMVDSLAATDRQLTQAAQPLGREETDIIVAALGQDVFDAGLISRLSGRKVGCKTAKALAQFNAMGGGEEIERARGLLEKRQEQLDQIRKQMRLKALLEVWLFIHIPSTIALLGALTAHIISVFYYW